VSYVKRHEITYPPLTEHELNPLPPGQPYAGNSPDESSFLESQGNLPQQQPAAPPPDPNWGQRPDQVAPAGSPYAGAGQEDANFMASQGELPPQEPQSAPEGVREVTGIPRGETVPEPPPQPGRFSHVIATAQKALPGLQQKLEAAQAAGDDRRAAQIQRHIDVANRQISDLSQRQNFGRDEYKGYLAGEGVKNPDQATGKLFEPGGQLAWYQSAANNAADGKAPYADMSSQSPQLATMLENSRKEMGSAPPGKTELATKTASFIEQLFEKASNLYGRTDSTVPKLNQPGPRTANRERFKRMLKLPLPSEPEKVASCASHPTAAARFVQSLFR
jgi:hypothetical protein